MEVAMAPTVLLLVLDAIGVETLNWLLDNFPNQMGPWTNLSGLGLGNLVAERHRVRFYLPDKAAYATSLVQTSASPDSVIGHREMMGVVDARTYNLFPDGFPPRFIDELECRIGRTTMFNQMAGGLAVIEENMDVHAETGNPIVYASKCDPLIQIAMDEAIIPVPEQHQIAEIAFHLALEMGIPLTRSIARSFVRLPDGDFKRTGNRHDVVLPLSGRTLVDILHKQHVWTVAVGKTADLVNDQKPAPSKYHEEWHLTDPFWLNPVHELQFPHPAGSDNNPFSFQGIFNALDISRTAHRPKGTFVFANLVDTDSLYGHVKDAEAGGALRSIGEFDRVLSQICARLNWGDLLIVTADHGMNHHDDYGYHSVEPLPFLVRRIGHNSDLGGLELGRGEGLTQVGDLVAQMFGCADQFRKSIVHVPA
jgi:phosphopentomutase